MKPRDTKSCPWVNKKKEMGPELYIGVTKAVFAVPQIQSPNSQHSADVRNLSENITEAVNSKSPIRDK